jgi:hypothetical protein
VCKYLNGKCVDDTCVECGMEGDENVCVENKCDSSCITVPLYSSGKYVCVDPSRLDYIYDLIIVFRYFDKCIYSYIFYAECPSPCLTESVNFTDVDNSTFEITTCYSSDNPTIGNNTQPTPEQLEGQDGVYYASKNGSSVASTKNCRDSKIGCQSIPGIMCDVSYLL